ncbi:hypothetical protein [Nonomuraea sp. NPDC005650]|uniref:hypothetical protein n=1 Tax=Nonomuraea sp. NPDC005650 TaxID=3157045 RepID=UPI0033B22BE6
MAWSARLLVPGETPDGFRIAGFRGRRLARAGLLLTAVSVPSGVSQAGLDVSD